MRVGAHICWKSRRLKPARTGAGGPEVRRDFALLRRRSDSPQAACTCPACCAVIGQLGAVAFSLCGGCRLGLHPREQVRPGRAGTVALNQLNYIKTQLVGRRRRSGGGSSGSESGAGRGGSGDGHPGRRGYNWSQRLVRLAARPSTRPAIRHRKCDPCESDRGGA